VEECLNKQIQGLGDKVANYQAIHNQQPDRYIENTCFPNLKLPIGAGFYLPAKWIKSLDTRDILCFTAHDSPRDALHIIPIYASPCTSDNTLTGPIPQWFQGVLTGLHAQFLHMVECVCKFKDWGVAADLVCYQEYDKEFNTINAKIKRLQLNACTVEQDCVLCEQ
jgi:hypothetical protein